MICNFVIREMELNYFEYLTIFFVFIFFRCDNIEAMLKEGRKKGRNLIYNVLQI